MLNGGGAEFAAESTIRYWPRLYTDWFTSVWKKYTILLRNLSYRLCAPNFSEIAATMNWFRLVPSRWAAIATCAVQTFRQS